ncbi:predicted protein [Uncinocarpus reesii 1704]|uniref:Kinetochore protein fta4 n=1 Tax=Uncinocarpus reesii (strain UAMH 1704) TaxID=336963 RepID=C4JNX1_UNCRE|nr:uncharacterized protein UREG_04441 [Uncinocarpus reesii 1704]EEP79595.1 predicted protein [Uncinocarpus reesii 1704]
MEESQLRPPPARQLYDHWSVLMNTQRQRALVQPWTVRRQLPKSKCLPFGIKFGYYQLLWSPSEDWRDYGPETESDIPDKVVDGVLQKRKSRVQSRIQRLQVSYASHYSASSFLLVIAHAVILTDRESRSIEKLPDDWTEENVTPESLERQFHSQLVVLNAERNEQRKRLAQYMQLRTLLEPFNQPQTNVQPNLVTKDGQLAAELDRMRMLLAKVAGKVQQIGQQQGGLQTENSVPQEDMDTKLAKILDMT